MHCEDHESKGISHGRVSWLNQNIAHQTSNISFVGFIAWLDVGSNAVALTANLQHQ
jgi:hypothetical protein